MTKTNKCRFCEYKRDYEYLVQTKEDRSDGLEARIYSDQLVISGWYDSMVGIGTEQAKINYCPICGRKLESAA